MQKKCNFAILRYQFALFQHLYACMRALCAIPNIIYIRKKHRRSDAFLPLLISPALNAGSLLLCRMPSVALFGCTESFVVLRIREHTYISVFSVYFCNKKDPFNEAGKKRFRAYRKKLTPLRVYV